MGVSEKVAYLQGLIEGLELDDSTKEGKILLAMADVIQEIADSIDILDEGLDILSDQVDDMDHDFEFIAETLMEDAHDHHDEHKHHHGKKKHHHGHHGSCGCGHNHGHEDMELYEDVYQVTCPTCQEDILLTEEMLDDGEINCPNCGEYLEFDFDGFIEEPDAPKEAE